MEATKSFAILAPVPEVHLLAGVAVCEKKGKVAFGSRAWEVFREVDIDRAEDEAVLVLIYASHQTPGEKSKAVATWRAEYVRHVKPKDLDKTLRPSSTESDTAEHWAIFWEVRCLQKLKPDEVVKISSLRGLGKKKFYAADFVPEGPLRIEYPPNL